MLAVRAGGCRQGCSLRMGSRQDHGCAPAEQTDWRVGRKGGQVGGGLNGDSVSGKKRRFHLGDTHRGKLGQPRAAVWVWGQAKGS